jgi:hypothetical protein
MRRINRRLLAAVGVLLAVAGCQRELTGIDAASEPGFTESNATGGVGTLGSGNKSDSTSTTMTTQVTGVGTLGSGN